MSIFLKKVPTDLARCYRGKLGEPIEWCRLFHEGCWSGNCAGHILLETPRPPDGTRCRNLRGEIRVVGVDV